MHSDNDNTVPDALLMKAKELLGMYNKSTTVDSRKIHSDCNMCKKNSQISSIQIEIKLAN